HHLVQLGAYPGDLALADARHAQGLYQLVHLARADAENVGLLDDGHQRFLGAAPWLQQAREIASLPQFGNAEVDGAHPRLPSTLTVAVAMRHTLRRPLVTVRTDLAAHLDLHQQLNEPLQRVAEKVGAGSPLVKQLLKCHSKVSGELDPVWWTRETGIREMSIKEVQACRERIDHTHLSFVPRPFVSCVRAANP